MSDLDSEENLKRLLKEVCKPITASPEFQNRLQKTLSSEIRQQTERQPRRILVNPLLWTSIAAVVALALIIYSFWGTLSTTTVVSPVPESPPAVTPEPEIPPGPLPELPEEPVPGPRPSPVPEPEPEPEPSEPPVLVSTGTLEMRITDAPPARDVSSIMVSLSDIRVQRDIDGTEGEEEWLTVVEGPISFDLILLRDQGTEEIIGAAEIDIGHYTQIRMNVTLDEATIDYETVDEGIIFPSEVLKTAGNFYIEEGNTTVLTFDFDAEKSLVFLGNGNVIFQPVVKLIVTGPE